jgi:hypothetical protein
MKLDLSGASPALFRGEEAKRNQLNKSGKANSSKTVAVASYTQLRSSVTPLQKKARGARKKVEDGSESESSSEVEDDQPSGKCQYVGDTSNISSTTINNTSMTSTASVRRKGNNSVRQMSQSVTSPATTSTAPLSPPPVSKTSSVFSCLCWVVVAGVAIMVYAVMLEGQGSNKLLSSTSQDTREHWLGARNMFRSELRSLVAQFPNQSSTTWKMISATLKSPMASSPEYPGVLLLLSTPSSQDTATCLASRLAQVASKAFSQPGFPPASQQQQLVIPSLSLPSVDPHQAKEELTALLHSSLSTWGVSVITSLHQLHPVPALTLHAFADNSNAPYKQAVIILSLSHSVEDEEVATSLEKRAEMVLAREWSKELGEDKLYALISRLVVSVAEVQKENGELLANC